MGVRSGTSYGLLGQLEVTTDTGVVPLTRAQRAIVVALVLGRRRAVPIDVLADAVWGEEQPLDAASALRSHVTRLRRALRTGADDLTTTDGAYRLDVDRANVDVERFENLLHLAAGASNASALEALDEALGLWRGRAVEEFADRPFAQGESARLDSLRLDALEQRANRLLQLGRPEEAAASLGELLDADPGREHGRELLMTALYRSGRHTEALASYTGWRRYLEEELGLEPSPRLRELEAQILRHAVPDGYQAVPAGPAPFADGRRPPATTGSRHRAPLPKPVSSFVGRDRELSAITGALADGRLLTLTGAGGVGKTRLALEVAARTARRYADGVVFCDLGSVRRAADVPRALATATRLRDDGHSAVVEQLVTALAEEQVLIVLDNCEHVLDGAAALVEALTQGTTSVDVLATSRERLAADGERTIIVEPLAVGLDGPAVVLFVERARACGWSAPDDRAHLVVVDDLCRRLDGLPLAIELAAARSRALAVEDLAAGLAHRFDLLVSGRRTNERHRSLRAVIDWTYAELTPNERSAFELVCATNGPFDLEQAASLLDLAGIGRPEVPSLIARLVERSLLACRAEAHATRYVLLETLRAYGIERLRDRGALEEARSRHASWVLGIVERRTQALGGENEKLAAEELDRLVDEMRAAHAWLVGHHPDVAMRMVDALHNYAFWWGRAELFRWAQISAAACPSSPSTAAVMASACAGAWLRGDLPSARRLLEGAAVAARGTDPIQSRRVVQQTSELALLEGRLDDAASGFDEAAALSIRAGDLFDASWNAGSRALALAYAGLLHEAEEQAETGTALAASCGSPSARAFMEFVHGEVAALEERSTAEAHLHASIALADSVDNSGIAGLARVTLATINARQADTSTALADYLTVIGTWQRTEAWTSQWVTLRNLVPLLVRCGADRDAALLYAATMQPRSAAPAYGRDRALLDHVRQHLDRVFTGDELYELLEAGRALADEGVVELAIDAVNRALSRSSAASSTGTDVSRPPPTRRPPGEVEPVG